MRWFSATRRMNFILAPTAPSFKAFATSASTHLWVNSFTISRSSARSLKQFVPAALSVTAKEACSHVVSTSFTCIAPLCLRSLCFATQPKAMFGSSYQDLRRDAHHGASTCSGSNSATPADIGQQEEEGGAYVMVEKGAQLMLQQHLHHFSALTVSEQQRWKQPIINALRSKSFNDGSKYFFLRN